MNGGGLDLLGELVLLLTLGTENALMGKGIFKDGILRRCKIDETDFPTEYAEAQ